MARRSAAESGAVGGGESASGAAGAVDEGGSNLVGA